MPMLEVNDIHTYYGNIHALKGISLKVEKGENRHIDWFQWRRENDHLAFHCGLQKPRQGNILLEGEDIGPFKAHEIVTKGVAMVPEGRGILPD